jgi:tetraacyldisaccharide 4'-kinase
MTGGSKAWHRMLAPLTPLYRGAVTARIVAYRRGWLRSTRLPAPVVSVGNLTFGGTGKTPTVVALVRDLVRRGRHPAVLTRGYGREVTEPRVLIGPEPGVELEMAGDEPLELAHRLPGVPVVVDADRVRGGIEALTRGADVLVLDDGFQHLRLERDLDLVLVDAGDPWGGGRMPPRGRLREPLSGLERADAVVVTKVPSDPTPVVAEVRRVVERHATRLPVLAARLVPTTVRRPNGSAGPEILAGARVLAVAGLGRPEGFAELLRSAGAEVVETRWFADHHVFTSGELDAAVARAAELEAVLATTAKDAVRMPAGIEVWIVEARMVPVDDGWDELWRLVPELEP